MALHATAAAPPLTPQAGDQRPPKTLPTTPSLTGSVLRRGRAAASCPPARSPPPRRRRKPSHPRRGPRTQNWASTKNSPSRWSHCRHRKGPPLPRHCLLRRKSFGHRSGCKATKQLSRSRSLTRSGEYARTQQNERLSRTQLPANHVRGRGVHTAHASKTAIRSLRLQQACPTLGAARVNDANDARHGSITPQDLATEAQRDARDRPEEATAPSRPTRPQKKNEPEWKMALRC